jgi:hypothetical protein
VGFTIAFVTRNIVLTIVGGMMAIALFGWAAG